MRSMKNQGNMPPKEHIISLAMNLKEKELDELSDEFNRMIIRKLNEIRENTERHGTK